MFPHLYHGSHVFCDIHYYHQARFIASCPYTDKQVLWPPRGRVRRKEFANFCDRYKHLVGNCYRAVPSEQVMPGDFAFP